MHGWGSLPTVEKRPTVTRLAFSDEYLGSIELPQGMLQITRGLGSGLARRKGDPQETIWAIGDRGPNLKIDLAVERYGLTDLKPLAKLEGAKIMPRLDIGPSISELRMDGDHVSIVRSFPLRDRAGKPLSGAPTPGIFSEPAFALDGSAVSPDPMGADTEGLAAAADGTFWVADEYGPSLLHVASDGTVLARWIPRGAGNCFAGVDHPVMEVLPAIAIHRQINRGFEAISLSQDETALFVAFQSPLALPDEATHRRAAHVRIWKIDLGLAAVVAEYLYPLDSPESFKRDAALGLIEKRDLKVSEMIALDDNRLLLLERASATTKLYSVRLGMSDRLAARYRDLAQLPSIETLSSDERLDDDTPVLEKRLLFSTDDHPQISADLEGMALINRNTLLLVNDNDFGIEDVKTEFWRIDLDLL